MGKRLPSSAAAAAAVVAAAATRTSRGLGNLGRLAADPLEKALAVTATSETMSSSPRSKANWWSGADPSTTGRGTAEGAAECRDERIPLSEVVSDCVKRWFQDTLKEARAGDVAMQVLVGQMYNSGYGVARNVQKGKAWISKASRCRPSALKVCEKRPGYNVSDSDSDESNDVTK